MVSHPKTTRLDPGEEKKVSVLIQNELLSSLPGRRGAGQEPAGVMAECRGGCGWEGEGWKGLVSLTGAQPLIPDKGCHIPALPHTGFVILGRLFNVSELRVYNGDLHSSHFVPLVRRNEAIRREPSKQGKAPWAHSKHLLPRSGCWRLAAADGIQTQWSPKESAASPERGEFAWDRRDRCVALSLVGPSAAAKPGGGVVRRRGRW